VEQREGLKKKDKPKSTALFDVIKDIKYYKNGDMLDVEGSEAEAAYNNFIAMRFLSMNESLCPLVNTVNHLQDVFDKKEMYKLLIELVPETNSFDGFIKAKTDKEQYEEEIAQYYECSIKEAREYVKIMGLEWAEQIHKSFGGVQ
jgi:sulfatase maturation enzyme AslB (radical SAM superfamily)